MFNFIRINLKQAPRNVEDILYNASVHSILEYAAAAWDPDTKAFINKLESIQNRAACFVTGSCDTNTIKKALSWDCLKKACTVFYLSFLNEKNWY